MDFLESFLLPLIFILGASSITALTKALQILGRIQSKKEFRKKPHYFFAYPFIKKLFSKDPWNNLFYLLSATKHLLRLLYATTLFLSLFLKMDGAVLICIAIVIGVALFFDFFFRFIVNFNPPLILRIVTPPTTFFLFLFAPLTFLLLQAQRALFQRDRSFSHGYSRARVKDKILEVVHESELTHYLEPFDRKIITAVASFRDRIAREIMVPRIDVFTLSVNQTVQEAAKKFVSEGYSRIPVYKESVDAIIGVLLYKDVMEYYLQSSRASDSSLLDTPLEKLIPSVPPYSSTTMAR